MATPQGGSLWTAINGPAPKGWVWDANGQPMKQSGWDTFDNAVTGAVRGSMTGGLVGAGASAIGSFGGNAPRPAGYQMTNPNAPYGGGYSAPSYGAAPGGSSPFGNFFDDPTTQPINTAWNQRMTQLNQAAPDYGDINNILQGYLAPDPRFNAALGTLQAAASGGGAKNAYTDQYAAATKQRMGELNAEPFSASDEAALKARFFDSLALQRDDAYQQNAQQMASRGLAPTSGVAQALGAETSAGYQKARAGQQQALLQYVTDERNRRRDEAVQMSSGLAARGGDDAALAQQWQATRAGILGNVVQALMAEKNQGMNAATTMASLRRQQYLDDQSRGDALLQTSALPNALATQRMAAMQSVLSGTDPFNQMMQLQQMQNQQDQIGAQRTGALIGAAGQIGAGVVNKLPWDKWLGGMSSSNAGTDMSGGIGMSW
jgi:hypothetical protein